jgi:hypothetical protein
MNTDMKNRKFNLSLLTSAATGILALALCGCTMTPLKGGHASTVSKSTQGIEQSVVQGDNPAAASRQNQETVRTKSYTVPAPETLGPNAVETLEVQGIPARVYALHRIAGEKLRAYNRGTRHARCPVKNCVFHHDAVNTLMIWWIRVLVRHSAQGAS